MKTKNENSQKQLVRDLLIQAQTELNSERRSEVRIPFFRSVSVKVAGRSFSAFIREISISSIGLLHNMELPLKDVEITVAGQREGITTRIERCEPCGEGWYISGGTIVDCDD